MLLPNEKQKNDINMLLNAISGITSVDINILLYEDTEFLKFFSQTFNNKNNDYETVINKSVEYINNNY